MYDWSMSEIMTLQDTFIDAITSAGVAILLDGGDVNKASMLKICPSVQITNEYSDYPVYGTGDISNSDIFIKITDDKDSFVMSKDAALDFATKLTALVNKLNTIEDKYHKALDKISKDKAKASKEANETLKF